METHTQEVSFTYSPNGGGINMTHSGEIPQDVIVRDAPIWLMLVYGVIALLGASANLFLICFYCIKLRTVKHAPYMALCVADGIFCAVALPMGITVTFLRASGRISDAACAVSAATLFLCSIMSVAMITWVSATRYLHVCRPAAYRALYKSKLAKCYSPIVFLVCVVWAASLFIPSGFSYSPTVHLCVPSFHDCLPCAILTAIFDMFLPASVVITCYALVLRKVRSQDAALKSSAQTTLVKAHASPAAKTRKAKLTRLTWVVCVTMIAFVVFWFPLAFVLLLKAFMESDMPLAVIQVSFILALCNTIADAIVYGMLNHRLRTDIIRSFRCTSTQGGENDYPDAGLPVSDAASTSFVFKQEQPPSLN